MAKTRKVNVGSKFIEMGRVYRVFKIEQNKAGERILHYRPYYKALSNSTTICSIPEKNLERGNIRFPVSRTELKGVIESLSATDGGMEADVVESKSVLKENDIYKSAEILKCFWCERQKEEEMKKSKRDVMELAIERIVEEVALVHKVSLEKARADILSALER